MKANFSQLGNDLYWSVFVGGKILRWQGYNDTYWWDRVSKTDQFQIKTSAAGTRYRLNPDTDEVCPEPHKTTGPEPAFGERESHHAMTGD